MTTCPTCSRALPDGVQFCPACGKQLPTDSFVATRLLDDAASPARKKGDGAGRAGGSTPSSRESLDRGRFVAGTVLAERYRIITLLGRGGMGEVYKAEDLKLEQTVALKFLPESLSSDGAALARLYREVRVARQISHRNVCRVYDIGETGGAHFLSMEFVPGEELASLLRRIGRLPEDKAAEVARQLCAGLSAAHEQGVLHRDLKPANVMIDDAGNVRVLDFGLAGLADNFSGHDIRSGTPAYMAPEQLAGKEVTTRSDIYALGLVIYELFTGRRAFEARSVEEVLRLRESNSTPTSASSLVKDLDPLVERVIERCLEVEPQRRPSSALQVAAALPGGDPVAAALAAGETPSPEMVAAAPKEGVLRPAAAAALLASVLAAMVVVAILSGYVSLHRLVPLDKPPDVLRERAAEIANRLGYAAAPVDTADGFGFEYGYLLYVDEDDMSPRRWDALARGRPPAVTFWHRRSPRHLEPNRDFFVRPTDPANDVAGMVLTTLDTAGRLFYFEAVPPLTSGTIRVVTQPTTTESAAQSTAAPSTTTSSAATPSTATPSPLAQSSSVQSVAGRAGARFDWSALFREAGLDPAGFREVEPLWTPPQPFDARAAWEGAYPEAPDYRLHVEAASFDGRPVYFEIFGPWTFSTRQAGSLGDDTSGVVGFGLLLTLFFGSLVAGALLAWRNLRLGRGDRRGALRLALFVLATRLVYWASITHHAPTIGEITNLLVRGLQSALFWACFVGLMYLGLEPFLRRRWPGRVVSWARLLAGDLRDPLVGRDLLVGGAAGMAVCVLFQLKELAPVWLGALPNIPDGLSGFQHALVPSGFAPHLMNQIDASLSFTFIIADALLLFSIVLRSNRAGMIAGWLLLSVLLILLTSTQSPAGWLLMAAAMGLQIFVLTRYGLLAMMSSLLFQHFIVFFPVTTDLSAWYATNFILEAVFLLAIALYAFRTSLGGQPVFRRGLLDE